MSNHGEDLELLLSLDERVLETPPASPTSDAPLQQQPGYDSDDGLLQQHVDMSVFKDTVGDYKLLAEDPPKKVDSNPKQQSVDVEKFSGLRVKSLLLSATYLIDRFSDMRFIRLSAIRTCLMGDNISGCWATAGVLTEKGNPKLSSTGSNFCVWKLGCLDEQSVPVFLFGDAYINNSKESVGSIFALFNCNIRKDPKGSGFSLSAYTASQILKLGTSADFGICKGKRKDGNPCSMAINRSRGVYCSYHVSAASRKFVNMRSELKGGNIKTAFRDPLKLRGIHLVDPLSNKTNLNKSMKPVKVLSVDALKRALCKADKVTTVVQSQGRRFLAEITEKMNHQKEASRGMLQNPQQRNVPQKRPCSSVKMATRIPLNAREPDPKRKKVQQVTSSENMIELHIVSSDEEM
ncbi:protein MCM10 homolog [Amborella trichopoda]|uniref:Uncharacterized protein n=1 Tax=Amborella trichopoda TaxID=13333 RepID=W1NTJ8_AMBTC|nr:protein MCM10 homolog [Amborella trichopoda]ERM98510.1 hypothetical protein AMTR_s00113p00015230 [Amborella trichopoda]|eukprot:XP_020518198.1 protein MCM10 homolog [Amborella trichopoda]